MALLRQESKGAPVRIPPPKPRRRVKVHMFISTRPRICICNNVSRGAGYPISLASFAARELNRHIYLLRVWSLVSSPAEVLAALRLQPASMMAMAEGSAVDGKAKNNVNMTPSPFAFPSVVRRLQLSEDYCLCCTQLSAEQWPSLEADCLHGIMLCA